MDRAPVGMTGRHAALRLRALVTAA